jgi:hypothetical protein
MGLVEATSGFEPLHKGFADLPLSHLGTSPVLKLELFSLLPSSYFLNGAGDGIRTRDPNLGKVVLYQLSYTRKRI